MGEKKYNNNNKNNCLHKIWGPKKRCEEEKEEDAQSGLFLGKERNKRIKKKPRKQETQQ
jgi:hypothetical protein